MRNVEQDGRYEMCTRTSIYYFPIILCPSDRSIPWTLKRHNSHALRLTLRIVNEEGLLQRSNGFLEQLLARPCLNDNWKSQSLILTSTSFSATSPGSLLRKILLPCSIAAGLLPAGPCPDIGTTFVRHAGGARPA
jgi:hypothetical protein